jgi:hypothetical protein
MAMGSWGLFMACAPLGEGRQEPVTFFRRRKVSAQAAGRRRLQALQRFAFLNSLAGCFEGSREMA